jgi:L-ascorbate metabolism protein UlaG (beta-lactamase superfamily)
MGRPTADVVTISNASPHHDALDAVAGSPRVVRGPGEYEIGGVMIAGVATPGERLDDRGFGRNTAYTIEIDEVTICHLGRIGRTLTTEQIEALKSPDVVLVPAGGGGAISLSQIGELISQLDPRLVVPMQFALPGVKLALEPLEQFCREMGVQDVRVQPRLAVTKSSLPEDTTVAILEAAAARPR